MSRLDEICCPIARTATLIGDRWTPLIVRDLAPGCRRFSELQRSLGNISPKQAPTALFAALSDSSASVRDKAAWALYEIRDPRALSALKTALAREQSASLKRGLIYAIAALGEESTDAIEALLDSKEPGMRDVAIRALAGDSGFVWPMPWPDPRPNP